MQDVVQGRVADIEDDEHEPEGAHSIQETNVPNVQRNLRRKPEVVAKALDKNPFVDGVDTQKENRLRIELDVPNGFSGRPRGEVLVAKHRIDGVDDQVVVHVDGKADQQSSQDPVQQTQIPGIEELGICVVQIPHSSHCTSIENDALELLFRLSVHASIVYFELVDFTLENYD